MIWCGRNVDDVHNLMDDVAEQQEIANEISDAISNPVGFQQDVDEVSLPTPSLYNCLVLIPAYISARDFMVFESV